MSKQSTLLNRSFLYIKSGILRQKQVETAFEHCVRQVQAAFPEDKDYVDFPYEINVVTDTRNNLKGLTYFWTPCHKLNYILTGKNPDGTERVEKYRDPKWVPSVVKPKAETKAIVTKSIDSKTNKYVSSKAWADMSDDEDEDNAGECSLTDSQTKMIAITEKSKGREAADQLKSTCLAENAKKKEEEKLYRNAPMLTRKLDPIATLPAVEYTDDQILEATRNVRKIHLSLVEGKAGKWVDRQPNDPEVPAEFKEVLVNLDSMKKLFLVEEEALKIRMMLSEAKKADSDHPKKVSAEDQQILDKYEQMKKLYPSILTEIPKYGHFEVFPGWIYYPKPLAAYTPADGDEQRNDPTTICCRTAPDWITEEIIRPYFEKFNTDPSKQLVKRNSREDGGRKNFTQEQKTDETKFRYPMIRVKNKNNTKIRGSNGESLKQKTIHVTFSGNGDHIGDAGFCLFVRTKFIVTSPDGKLKDQLIFSYWKANPNAPDDRDSSRSKQKPRNGSRNDYNRSSSKSNNQPSPYARGSHVSSGVRKAGINIPTNASNRVQAIKA